VRPTTALLVFASLLAAGAVRAQTTEPEPPATEVTADAATGETPAPGAEEPRGFTYDPGGRRDPFVSLLFRGTDTSGTGTRVAGLAGLSTTEVTLRGTLRSQGVFVGILQGSDGKNYTVRAGDQLADGTIRTISADEMVVLQQVNDPLSLEQEREVRKMLRQEDEAR
jgi:Tfp pilus assembly protein PilP